jgi:hypothetical protein
MQSSPAFTTIPELTDPWRVVHRVERSDLPRYVGLRIEFQVKLVEFGGSIVGNGEKFLVDYELASRDAASRLEISGVVERSDIRLFLMERPEGRPNRSIVGEIVWRAIDADHLAGAFRVDHQRTSGTSEAVRWGAGGNQGSDGPES